MRRIAALLLAACAMGLGLPAAQALYSGNGPVVELTPANMQAKIKSGGVWMV